MRNIFADRRVVMVCLALMVAAQLGVLGAMIARRELVLATGTPFKFRTAPVDPYDAFRGKYVALNFESTSGACDAGAQFEPGQRVYASLVVETNGFARLDRVTPVPPEHGLYIGVDFRHRQSETVAVVALPFDRFYLEERMAPRAEVLYREHSRAANRDAWALVRVRSGLAVIEDLYIGGRPMADLIQEARAAAAGN